MNFPKILLPPKWGCVLFGTFFKSFSVCHQNECILFIALDCGDFYSGYALMLVDFVKLLTLDRNKYKTVNWNYFEIRDKSEEKREERRHERKVWPNRMESESILFQKLHLMLRFSFLTIYREGFPPLSPFCLLFFNYW